MSLEKDMSSKIVLDHFQNSQNILTSNFVEIKESINLSQNLKNAEKS